MTDCTRYPCVDVAEFGDLMCGQCKGKTTDEMVADLGTDLIALLDSRHTREVAEEGAKVCAATDELCREILQHGH